MKRTTIVQVPATTREESTYTCELCGAKLVERGSEVSEATVECKVGESWGSDGASIDKTVVDLCVACFKTKLLPWLVSQGATPREEDGGW